MFKEWFEQQYQKGKISLLKSVLLNQAIENTNYVSIAPQGETLFGWGGDTNSTSENMKVV